MSDQITIPASYVTEASSEILVTNYPPSSAEVTPIQIVTLNRPKKLNAITSTMITTLITLFRTVNLDDRVKVVILTGAGDKAFSAGIDLSMDTSKLKDTVPPKLMRDPGGTLALSMLDCSKPIIVAYNGLSVGIGMTSTLAGTIRYVLTSGFFCLFFVRFVFLKKRFAVASY